MREPREEQRRARRRRASRRSRPTARRCTRSSSARGYNGPFLPGYVAREIAAADAGLLAIDHIVGNVELGHMDEWVSFYEDVFGMTEMIHFSDEAISTEYSALMSKVVADGKGRVKFPINEPAEGKRKSQIDEYLEFYEGAGRAAHRGRDARHRQDRRALRERGVEFLRTPEAYYDDVPGAHRRDRRGPRRPAPARHPRRPRRRGLPAADLHQAGRRPADDLLRDHRAPRRARLRRGQLQGALRGDRARAGAAGEPVAMRYVSLGEVPQKRHVQVREAARTATAAADRGGARLRGLLAATSRSSTTCTRRAGSPTSATSRRSCTRSGCPTRTCTG